MIGLNKNYRSDFSIYEPLYLFNEFVGGLPAKTKNTQKRLYNLEELTKGIEKYFKSKDIEFLRFEEQVMIKDNSLAVTSEIVYLCSGEVNILIGIKSDISDTLEDDDYYEDPESHDEDEEEMLRVKMKLENPLIYLNFFYGKMVHGTKPAEEAIVEELISGFVSKEAAKVNSKNQVYFVTNDEFGFSLKSFKIKPTIVDIENNYNDNFMPAYEKITDRLKSSNHGLILFHGEKGSGKTSLVRHLTSIITDKRIIYVAPELAINISQPNFISFFLKYPNSILIIEDAENILKTRKAGGNQAVANLLNLSDGLLGDALKLQIICTLNAGKDEIDDALRRPGRLIAEYEFDKLKLEKTKKLFDILYPNNDFNITKEMTLAEIFNYKEKKIVVEDNSSPIGFRR
jgi:energy-coupling factor transporter ATP-binding protein EcfA2